MSWGLTVDQRRLAAALETAKTELLAQRNAAGHWEGELSSSALSTATAIAALAIVARESKRDFTAQIESGLRWLADHANADGGWGDTTISRSNLSTTTLCWAAFGAARADERFAKTVSSATAWLRDAVGSSSLHALARAIIARYGKDRTFSAPILTLCALSGRLGPGPEAWEEVIQLPFELAAFPRRLYAVLRLPVVSYALPALIAVGQAKHHHAPTGNAIIDGVRTALKSRTLDILRAIQPSNGGFLEATPLTSFVTMSLAGSGHVEHPVTRKGVEFLLASQRGDGSWPIDTNLATWVTTLAVNAMPALNSIPGRDWVLNQQYLREHLYTGAAPGGWAWTDLPGGVPDADDTSGAVLALSHLGREDTRVQSAAFKGIEWLIRLQNADGGLPTFCRGWGALPFDRSSADITAHGIQAWLAWLNDVSPTLQRGMQNAIRASVQYLARAQRFNGAWAPLWFGNEHAPDEQNLTYGTARVLAALAGLAGANRSPWFEPYFERLLQRMLSRSVKWLIDAQQQSGGWSGADSGPVSIEESALALIALARALPQSAEQAKVALALSKGTAWLLEQVKSGGWKRPSPIGFYFARLWYYDRLYPMIFTTGALAAVKSLHQTISTGHLGIASRNA
jgi:squalene-hopene/tetraprenyl-beta-curcumene cyclase